MQFGKDLLRRFRHKDISLNKEDCEAVVSLMKNGFSFQDSMHILESKKNHPVFTAMRKELADGAELPVLFLKYCPQEYRSWYEGFSACLPFLESMRLTADLNAQEAQEKKQLVSGIAYPLTLMLTMMIGIAAFSSYVLPSMISLMNGFGLEEHGLLVLQKLISVLFVSFSLAALVLILVSLYLLHPSHITETYKLACRLFPDTLPAQYASREFSRFFLACIRVNVSTRETLSMLKHLKGKPLTAFLASELDRSFLEGKSMEEASDSPYVEHALSRFLKIAVYSSDCEHMLEGYLQMVQERSRRRIRLFSKTVQIVSYSCTGAVIILVYRIMLMPMAMIQQL